MHEGLAKKQKNDVSEIREAARKLEQIPEQSALAVRLHNELQEYDKQAEALRLYKRHMVTPDPARVTKMEDALSASAHKLLTLKKHLDTHTGEPGKRTARRDKGADTPPMKIEPTPEPQPATRTEKADLSHQIDVVKNKRSNDHKSHTEIPTHPDPFNEEQLRWLSVLFNGKNRHEKFEGTGMTRQEIYDRFLARFAKQTGPLDRGYGADRVVHDVVLKTLREVIHDPQKLADLEKESAELEPSLFKSLIDKLRGSPHKRAGELADNIKPSWSFEQIIGFLISSGILVTAWEVIEEPMKEWLTEKWVEYKAAVPEGERNKLYVAFAHAIGLEEEAKENEKDKRIKELEMLVLAQGKGEAKDTAVKESVDKKKEDVDTTGKPDADKETKKPAGGESAGDDSDLSVLPDFDLHAVKKQHVMDTMLLSLVDNHMGGIGEGDRAKYMNNLRSSDVARSLEKLRNRPLWKKVGSFILRSAVPVLVAAASAYYAGPLAAAYLLKYGLAGAIVAPWAGGILAGAGGGYVARTGERWRSNRKYGVGTNFLHALPLSEWLLPNLTDSKLVITGDRVREAAGLGGLLTTREVNRQFSTLKQHQKEYDRSFREYEKQLKGVGLVKQATKERLARLTKQIQEERARLISYDTLNTNNGLKNAQRDGEWYSRWGRIAGAVIAGGVGTALREGVPEVISNAIPQNPLNNISSSPETTTRALLEQIKKLQTQVEQLAATQEVSGSVSAGALEGNAGADTLGTGVEAPVYPLPRTAARMFGETLSNLLPGIDSARLQLGTTASPITNVFKNVMSGEDASRLVSKLFGVSEHDLQAYMHRAGLHRPVEVLSAQIPSNWKIDVQGVLQEKMHHGRTVLDTMLRSVDTTANTSPQDKTYIYATLTKLKDALA